MKLAIMQPYFLPYLGYWQLITAVDKFVLLDDVNFIKRGWINRNRILLNGREHLFTIPLVAASQNRKINELELLADRPWREKLLKTFRQAYLYAPQLDEVFPLLETIVRQPSKYLTEYLWHSLHCLAGYLGIQTKLVATSSIYGNVALKGEARIIDICRQEKADIYVNASGGRALYDPRNFAAHKLSLRFLESIPVGYAQNTAAFHPDLSVIDVLMFNPRDVAAKFLTRARLVA